LVGLSVAGTGLSLVELAVERISPGAEVGLVTAVWARRQRKLQSCQKEEIEHMNIKREMEFS